MKSTVQAFAVYSKEACQQAWRTRWAEIITMLYHQLAMSANFNISRNLSSHLSNEGVGPWKGGFCISNPATIYLALYSFPSQMEMDRATAKIK